MNVILVVLAIELVLAVWVYSAVWHVNIVKRGSSHSCERRDGNIGCIACVAYGATEEREAILTAIEEAPPAFDFFGPYIPRDTLMGFLKKDDNE